MSVSLDLYFAAGAVRCIVRCIVVQYFIFVCVHLMIYSDEYDDGGRVNAAPTVQVV